MTCLDDLLRNQNDPSRSKKVDGQTVGNKVMGTSCCEEAVGGDLWKLGNHMKKKVHINSQRRSLKLGKPEK